MSLKPRKVNFDCVWNGIQDTLQGVMTLSNVSKGVWNDRFLDIYIICTAIPDPLCDELYQATKIFLESYCRRLHEHMTKLDENILLQTYNKNWQDYSKGAQYLNLLYGYLNSQYIRKQKYKESDIKYGRLFTDIQPSENIGSLGALTTPGLLIEIGDLALVTWKNQVLQPMAPTLRELLIAAIRRDRNKKDADWASTSKHHDISIQLLHDIIHSFVEVEKSTKHPRKLYENEFESYYLEDTSDFYRNYSNYLLNEEKLSCSQYMHKVVAKLAEEVTRNKTLVDPSTLPKAESVCQKRLVTDVLPFLHTESSQMIKREMTKDLNLMYSILNPINDSLNALIQTLEAHISDVCMDKIKELDNDNDPTLFVESILAIHTRFKELIRVTFDSDNRFLTALDKACSHAINYKPENRPYCRAPEQLSRYCDILLKKSPKILPEAEIETKLSNVVILFAYLRDKDMFQQFYANMLAKRLIYGSSHSLDAEENMINKLKRACGYDFTNKLYRMFTDIRLSKDHNEGFQAYLLKQQNSAKNSHSLTNTDNNNNNGELPLPVPIPNFTVFILQAGAWPINQTNLPSFQTPVILEKCLSQFEQYYSTSFSGRKLMWLFHLSMGELKLNYLSKPYFLSLNTFQMAILLLFNNLPSANNEDSQTSYLTFDHIQRETGLANNELKKHLYALVHFNLLKMLKFDKKSDVLTPNNLVVVSPPVKAMNAGPALVIDATSVSYLEQVFAEMEVYVFALNYAFQNKKTKVKLAMPALPPSVLATTTSSGTITTGVTNDDEDGSGPSTSKKDSEKTYQNVEEDRKLYLQAVTVRIMKSRRNIHHNHLVQEVIEQSKTRFVPSVTLIKKCIETLIEKQYMKRNTEGPEEYSYIA